MEIVKIIFSVMVCMPLVVLAGMLLGRLADEITKKK